MPAVAPYFRRKIGRVKYPGLWRVCVWASCPSVMGHTGATMYDATHSQSHGVLTGFTLASAYSVSEGGMSLSLAGSQYVQAVSPVTNYPITLSAWVRPTNAALLGRVLSLHQSGTTGPLLSLYVDSSTFNAQAFSAAQSPTVSTATGGTAVSGAWHHIAGVFSLNTRTLYVNGAQVATATNPIDVTGIDEIEVGAIEFPTVTQGLTGNIDDPRVYNRELTSGEIRRLASARGIAYQTLPPPVHTAVITDLLDVRRRAVVC